MATCKTCGKEDRSKPGHWNNWDCTVCVNDELRLVDGTFTPLEKKIEYRKRKRKQ